MITCREIEPDLELLPFQLVLEELTPPINKVDSILELCLFGEYLNVQENELLVKFESWLFHKFQHQEIGNIKHLSLELEVQADQVHALNSPLGVYLLLMGLVQG